MPPPVRQPGDVVELDVTCRDRDGVLADPATVGLTITPASGAVIVKTYPTDAEIVRVSVGLFRYILVLASTAALGYWRWRWVTTGNPAQSESDSMLVEPG